jgi:hypothetical protein
MIKAEAHIASEVRTDQNVKSFNSDAIKNSSQNAAGLLKNNPIFNL